MGLRLENVKCKMENGKCKADVRISVGQVAKGYEVEVGADGVSIRASPVASSRTFVVSPKRELNETFRSVVMPWVWVETGTRETKTIGRSSPLE